MWPATGNLPRDPVSPPSPSGSRCRFPFRPPPVSVSVSLPGEKASGDRLPIACRGRLQASLPSRVALPAGLSLLRGVARFVLFLEQWG